jgi:sortase A
VSIETPDPDEGSVAPDGPDRRSGSHRAAGTATLTRSRPTSTGDRVRWVLSGLGQTLITLGLVVLLFVVYEVWITNIFADAKQHQLKTDLVQEWAAPVTPDDGSTVKSLPLPNGDPSAIPAGSGVAILYIPRFGKDYAKAIVQGTNDSDLEKGPGHYDGTQLPGQVGNFAVAGHRVGKGEPFLNLDQLQPGDPLVVETKNSWFIYRVKGDTSTGNIETTGADGIPGRQIVDPSDGQVILPVPNHPGAKATESLMTLTTCHPKFTATQRMIVFSALSRTVARQGNTLPKELGGTL